MCSSSGFSKKLIMSQLNPSCKIYKWKRGAFIIEYCHSTCLVATRLASLICVDKGYHQGIQEDFLNVYELRTHNATKNLYRLVFGMSKNWLCWSSWYLIKGIDPWSESIFPLTNARSMLFLRASIEREWLFSKVSTSFHFGMKSNSLTEQNNLCDTGENQKNILLTLNQKNYQASSVTFNLNRLTEKGQNLFVYLLSYNILTCILSYCYLVKQKLTCRGCVEIRSITFSWHWKQKKYHFVSLFKTLIFMAPIY